MLERLKLLKPTEFKKNVAVIFSGSAISQFVLILVTPWLSRLYKPDQFGIYGVFLSVAMITNAFSTFSYAQAIQIAKEQDDAYKLFEFCKISVLGVSVLILLLLLISYKYLILLLSIKELGIYILFLPLATLLAGLTEIYTVWLNRNKDFKSLAYNRVIISVVNILITITWAYCIDTSFKGLLIGSITAQFIGVLFLQKTSIKFKQMQTRFSWKTIKILLQSHKNFPIYILPTELINVFTTQLPVLMLSRFAGSTEVGYFNMSNRILGLPSIFISSSIGEVFKQRATEDYHKYGSCRPIFLKTLKALAFIAIFPFLAIVFFGPELFSTILGEQWRMAGEYSRILSLWVYFRFFVSPLSYVFYIAQKQRMHLIGHLLMLFGTAIPFYLGFIFFDNKIIPIAIFSITYSLVYLYYLYFSYKYTINKTIL